MEPHTDTLLTRQQDSTVRYQDGPIFRFYSHVVGPEFPWCTTMPGLVAACKRQLQFMADEGIDITD